MSRTFHNGERRIRVKGVRRNPPDLKRLARALIELARAQAEAEAQALQEGRPGSARKPGSPPPRRQSSTDKRSKPCGKAAE